MGKDISVLFDGFKGFKDLSEWIKVDDSFKCANVET